MYLLGISSCQTNSLGFCSSSFIFPQAFITHWLAHYSPFSPFSMFLDLLAYWALFLPLDSHNSFTLLLPFTCLWAHTLSFPSHIGPLGFYLFPWALMAHLLQLCFFHSFPSSSPFTIGLFFLSLGLLSKTGINIQPPEHVNCSYNSYANTSTISFVGFLKSGPHLAYLLQRTNLSFLIYQLF